MIGYIKAASDRVDAWLMAPEANAAGRLGIFRIIYASFYLWHLSFLRAANLSDLPSEYRKRVLIVDWLPAELPAAFFGTIEVVLVAALVVLLFGYYTRLATAVVLVTGCIIEGFLIGFDFEHSALMLVAVIPGFMLLVGDWSATYSLDALLRQRAGATPIDPRDTSPRFVLPIHAVLVVLVALFVSSGVYKLMPFSNWLSYPEQFGNLNLTVT